MTTRPYSTSVLVLVLLSILSVTGTVEECPPWFTLESSNSSLFPQCVCSDTLDFKIVCDQRRKMSFLQLGYCAFQDFTINGTVVADCPYVLPEHMRVGEHVPLPRNRSKLNQFICGNLNRDIGTPLCGRCTNGTGPSIYSAGSQCVSCSAVNIVYYLLLQYLPTTILFVAIIVFQINVTSAPMAHYVLYCNIVVLWVKSVSDVYSHYLHSHASILWKVLLTLKAMWSFDTLFFVSPPLCVSVHMEEIYIPFLDTVAILYPFILLVLTYVAIELHAHDFRPIVHLWRLVHRPFVRFRKTWDPNASVIQAFATLFLLSYSRLILLTHEALIMSVVINQQSQVVARVPYIDPTIPLYSQKHYLLIALAIFIFVFIVSPPILLLIIFPTRLFRKVSRYLKPRRVISIQTFVDTFHGCYKDGTNGTRDYRAASGYILAIFVLVPAAYMALQTAITWTLLLYQVSVVLFIALSVTGALLRPYKHKAANISVVVLPAMLASVIAFFAAPKSKSSSTLIAAILFVIFSLPHCVFYGYIVYRLGKLLKQYCCKTREMEDSVDEQLPCRPANSTGYTQLSEVSS